MDPSHRRDNKNDDEKISKKEKQALHAGPVIDATYSDNLAHNKAEMPSGQQPQPQELALVKSPGYEFMPRELPDEAPHELPPALPEKDEIYELHATSVSRI